MSAPESVRQALLRAIPDDPVNIDRRHALLHDGQIFGDAANAAIVPASGDYIATRGAPVPASLAAAKAVARPDAEVLAYLDNAGSLGCRLGTASLAYIHVLLSGLHPADRPLASTELITSTDEHRLTPFPERLRKEVAETITEFPAVVALDGGKPAALCYCAAWTETWWDLSIETLEAHQRQGLGEAAARRAIQEMAAHGLNTVWGALASNGPSISLARHLGFQRVGELYLFT